MLLQLDGTLIIMAISFIIFMFIMQKIFYSPMTEVRKERDNYIDETRNKARHSKEQAAILEAEYESKINQARTTANNIVFKSTSAATKEKTAIIEQKTQNLTEQVNQAKENILKDKNAAQDALKMQVSSLAQNISTKILGEEIPISGITEEMINKHMNG
ncbi:MAG: F0F1 ATP synthase subunit B [Candidatus Gastranaerophilales bacterium]|nr:F0F1 ATP synthase subunit B [Candidatus Gastranaerophilales bacterium]